jgi:hypothetical protein
MDKNKLVKAVRHLTIEIRATHEGKDYAKHVVPSLYLDMTNDMLERVIEENKTHLRQEIAGRPTVSEYFSGLFNGDKETISRYEAEERDYQERLAALKDLEFRVTEEWV